MTTHTIVGNLATQDGLTAWYWTGDFGGRHLERAMAVPADAYDVVQSRDIPVQAGHDGPQVGRVVHLEQLDGGNLRCVAVIDDNRIDLEQPWQLSGFEDVTFDRGGAVARTCRIRHVALVERTATIAAGAITVHPGDITREWHRERMTDPILRRAATTVDQDLPGRPLTIHRDQPVGRRIERRSRLAAPDQVRFGTREVDVCCVPYNSPAPVVDPAGRLYEEMIAPGAFGNVAARADRIRVLRDHQVERVVGRCRHLDGDHPDGLMATLAIARTDLGDETLALADAGCLDVSIGFMPRAERWNQDRSMVLRTAVHLHELSLVPFPAYEGAGVLAVRTH